MVVFRQKLMYSRKVVLIGKIGFIRVEIVVFGVKRLYSGKNVVIGQKWLYAGKDVVFPQK